MLLLALLLVLAAMAFHILQHLEGAAVLLGALPQGPSRCRVEAVQRDRLCALLRGARLTSLEAAQVVQSVQQVGFAGDAPGLMEAVAQAVDPLEGVGNTDKKFQNYEGLFDFLPASVWQAMAGSDGTRVLFSFLADGLGMEKPSESTMQTMSIILLAMSEGIEKAQTMCPATKNEYLKAVKRWWHQFEVKRGRRIPDRELMWVLPATPQMLPSGVAQVAYCKEGPAPSQVSNVMIERLRSGSWMRIHEGKQPRLSGKRRTSEMVVAEPQVATAGVDVNLMKAMFSFFRDMTRGGAPPAADSGLPGLRVFGQERSVATPAAMPAGGQLARHTSQAAPSGPRMLSDGPPGGEVAVGGPPPTSALELANNSAHAGSVATATERVLEAMAAKKAAAKAAGKDKAKAAKAAKAKDLEASSSGGEAVAKRNKKAAKAKDLEASSSDDEAVGKANKKAAKAKDLEASSLGAAAAAKPKAKPTLPLEASGKGKGAYVAQHEKSRCQFLARSRRAGCSSKSFKYGADEEFESEAAAKRAVAKFVGAKNGCK